MKNKINKLIHLKKIKSQRGAALLIAVLFFLIVSTTIVVGSSDPVIADRKMAQNLIKSKASYFASEAGVEDVSYRIIRSKDYDNAENLTLDDYTASTVVVDNNGIKEVTATGNASNLIRKTQANLIPGNSNGASFHYGIQVGNGGLTMQESSHVTGNVFSNGPILGTSLNIIRGDVISAGANGSIKKIQSYGSAYAHSIEDSVVGGSAYYIDIDNDTSVAGVKYPNSTDQVTVPLPITDEIVEQLKNEASVNVINSPCPYTVSSETTIGPVKINCDLIIKTSPTIMVAGNIWVVGNILVDGSPTIKLVNSLGNRSVAIIADNPRNRTTGSKIDLKSSAEFRKNSSGNGYFLFISQNKSSEIGGSVQAITTSGHISGNVLVNATHGEILFAGNVYLRGISGYKVRMRNGSEILYETGLANILFTSGPSSGYSVDDWQETQ